VHPNDLDIGVTGRTPSGDCLERMRHRLQHGLARARPARARRRCA
jgi:hypothetical protein